MWMSEVLGVGIEEGTQLMVMMYDDDEVVVWDFGMKAHWTYVMDFWFGLWEGDEHGKG